jgi:glycosyltransferase involved in cell wall biosynthesis
VIFYLTFNDLPSGIYSSQVIDVVKFLNTQTQTPTKLIAFISLRNFSKNRKKIRNELSEALVVPMVPRLNRWRLNRFLFNSIYWWYKPKCIIARSVLATQLALKTTCEKIVYDGRGAIAEEWKEYKVVNDEKLLSQIVNLERECVLNTQFRLAVSHQLVNYWREAFGYKTSEYVVIPCTINKVFENLEISQKTISDARKKMELPETAVVYVYSGSLAGWQSFSLMTEFLKKVLQQSKNNRMVFLSSKDKNILDLEAQFSDQVSCISVLPNEVPLYLIAADYGMLIREESITNQVASPVKFAEYLACGLKIIISNNLGDYTEFVINNNCGSLLNDIVDISKPSLKEKERIKSLSGDFKKQSHLSSYLSLLNFRPTK